MKTLFMDTAWKNLTVALFEDGKLITGEAKEAFHKQSEELLVVAKKLLEQTGWKLSEIDEVIVTDGPGSYTGLRIAMTVAKMMTLDPKVSLKTISTLELYAGLAEQANVILDARGKRAYAAHVENGKTTWSGILPMSEVPAFLDAQAGELYGEGELVGREALPTDFLKNAQDLLPLARAVENPDALVPVYMKENGAYLV